MRTVDSLSAGTRQKFKVSNKPPLQQTLRTYVLLLQVLSYLLPSTPELTVNHLSFAALLHIQALRTKDIYSANHHSFLPPTTICPSNGRFVFFPLSSFLLRTKEIGCAFFSVYPLICMVHRGNPNPKLFYACGIKPIRFRTFEMVEDCACF